MLNIARTVLELRLRTEDKKAALPDYSTRSSLALSVLVLLSVPSCLSSQLTRVRRWRTEQAGPLGSDTDIGHIQHHPHLVVTS